MKKPTPHVIVIPWSPTMRLKRRFEVAIADVRIWDMAENVVPIARYSTRKEADEHATRLRTMVETARRRENQAKPRGGKETKP